MLKLNSDTFGVVKFNFNNTVVSCYNLKKDHLHLVWKDFINTGKSSTSLKMQLF